MSDASQETIGWGREEIARNIALDIPDGSIVNLGIGIPEMVAACIPDDREVIFHTENGLLGMGPPPDSDQEDPELINAGKRHVTAIPGASYFHHADSFAMIRGGHIDICVLGAMQVKTTPHRLSVAQWIWSQVSIRFLSLPSTAQGKVDPNWSGPAPTRSPVSVWCTGFTATWRSSM
jgi:3-oxoacid CoA-transferase B subunit